MSTDAIPIPAIFVGTIIVVMIALEVGYRLGDVVHRRSADEKESPVSVIAGAILALATFMLAFTFGIVADRYDTKKGLVREDANAIRIAWHRSDFLPEPDRAQAKMLLSRYLDTRLQFAQERNLEPRPHPDRAVQNAAAAGSSLEHGGRERAQGHEFGRRRPLHRVAERGGLGQCNAGGGRNPGTDSDGGLGALFFLISLGMMVVGYQTAIAESKRSMIQPVLVASFALVITLIAALDRPNTGLKVTQQPLIDLRSTMSAAAGTRRLRVSSARHRQSRRRPVAILPGLYGRAAYTRASRCGGGEQQLKQRDIVVHIGGQPLQERAMVAGNSSGLSP